MLVYKIINIVNLKTYIGITSKSLAHRWRTHLNSRNVKSNRPLYNSMRKYGVNNFKIELICECSSKEEMFQKEMYYISLYKSNISQFGYNISSGGEFNIASEEARLKLSELSRQRWKNSEFKSKMIKALTGISKTGQNHFKGKKHTKESLEKISKSRTGKYTGTENHNFGKGVNTGKVLSEAHKAKISEKLKGNKNTPEYGAHFNARQIMCVDTGEIFNSVSEAKLKYPNGNLYKAAKQGRTSLGKRWKYV